MLKTDTSKVEMISKFWSSNRAGFIVHHSVEFRFDQILSTVSHGGLFLVNAGLSYLSVH